MRGRTAPIRPTFGAVGVMDRHGAPHAPEGFPGCSGRFGLDLDRVDLPVAPTRRLNTAAL